MNIVSENLSGGTWDMAKMKIVEGRRKHKRFNLYSGILVHNMANKVKVGQVIDIGIGGVKVHYDNPKNTVEPWHWGIKKFLLPKYNGYYNISVMDNGEECGLKQVQCKTVGDAGLVSTPPIGQGSLKRIEFAPLRHDQIFYLNRLIRKHMATPVKDRREKVDRRKNNSSTFPIGYERRSWWRERRVSAKKI